MSDNQYHLRRDGDPDTAPFSNGKPNRFSRKTDPGRLPRETDPGRLSHVSKNLRSFLSEVQAEEVNNDKKRLDIIIGELNRSKQSLLEAYLNVMLGIRELSGATTAERRVARMRNPDIDAAYDDILSLEGALSESEYFFRSRLPNVAATEPEGAALPSYSAAGVKYLLDKDRPGTVGFGLEIPLDEFQRMTVDERIGRFNYESSLKRIHIKPFFYTPPDQMLIEADKNLETYQDTHGRGYYVPTFVRLYTEFVAFALQDHPLVVGAHVLTRHKSAEAAFLKAGQANVVEAINAHILQQLGYVPTEGRAVENRSSIPPAAMGFEHIDSLINWRDFFCKRLFLVEFAASYKAIAVDKIVDMAEYMMQRNSIPPEATVRSF